MKPITQEWVDKAEGDLATTQRELKAQNRPNYDAACFHSQQCIEKYLKGCLQEANIYFDKTHDLAILLDLCLSIDSSWESLRSAVNGLNSYAVRFRYPGESATQADARQALNDCLQIRQVLRQYLADAS